MQEEFALESMKNAAKCDSSNELQFL